MGGDGSVKRRKRPEDVPFPSADDPDILDPILDELEADEDVRALAAEVAATAESTMWIVGKRRSTVAATAVYLAGALRGNGSPLFKQADVAAASGVSVGSIFNQFSFTRVTCPEDSRAASFRLTVDLDHSDCWTISFCFIDPPCWETMRRICSSGVKNW